MNADVDLARGQGAMAEPASLAGRMAPLALIVTLAFMGFGFLVRHPEGLFNRHSDLLAYHLGTQTVLHQSWQNDHRLPLWRQDILSGEPALTSPQSLYTHPLHALFLFFRPERVVGLVIWLQMLLAGLGGYYAGAVLKLSTPGRLIVAVATLFSFKTILVVYAGWLAVLAGIAAMPLLFGTAAAVLVQPSLRSAVLLGLAGALSLHAGNLQLTYYAALFIAVWSTARIVRHFAAGERRAATRVAGSLLLGAIVASGLAAYLVLPLAQDAGLVSRTAASYEFFLGSNRVPLSIFLTIFSPELFGTPLDGSFVEAWEHIVYFGAATSLLAAVGAVRGRKRHLVGVLMAGLVLSLVLGLQTPLLRIVHAVVPGYALFRLPARMFFLSALFASCLAGVGLDEMLSTIRDRRSRWVLAAFAIGLVALEGSAWARRYLMTANPIAPVPTAEYVKALHTEGQVARVAPLGRSVPSYGSAAQFGLQLVAGYDPFNMRHYQTYIDLLQYNRTPGSRAVVWTDINAIARFDMLAALNVLYLVAPQRIDVPTTEYALVGSFDNQPQFRFYEGLVSGPVYVYRNQRFLPRAFFVSKVLSVADEERVVEATQVTDLRETAVVAAPTAGGISVPTEGDRVDIVRATAGEIDLRARNAEPRFLLVSEVWRPGWFARMDGQAATLHRADVALQGLWLDPGDHRIELRYWPPGLTTGLIITGLTALGVVIVLAFLA